jgi:hypothetical protein
MTRLVEQRSPRPRREKPAGKDDATAQARADFYAAAERFEQSEPWTVATDGHILAVDVPALGWSGGCASILGAVEESFGLLLLRSLGDYIALLRRGARESTARRRDHGPGVPLLSVSFDHPRDVTGGKQLAREARALGWTPGPGARLPHVLKMSPDGVPQALSNDDYRLATVCLEAVRQFVDEHASLFEKPPTESVRMDVTYSSPGGPLEVVVEAPPDDLPWDWGGEEPIEGLRRLENQPLLEGLEASLRASGASGAEVDAAMRAIDDVLEFKNRRDEPGQRWSPQDVEEYLLEYAPAFLIVPDEELEGIPAHLAAFFDWLTSSGQVPAASLRATREQVGQCREAFLRHARDPRRFGPAKTILRAALEAGVEVSDNEAMEAFVEDFSRRAEEDPSLLPMLGTGEQRPKAWAWDGEGAPPDPRGPCRCGSGKRYRKCCMPR